jgi:hypothetical protein
MDSQRDTAFILEEMPKWSPVVEASGAKVD